MRRDPRDLPVVKVKTSEGLVARLLMVGIVHIVVVLISESSGTFLQNNHACGPPRPWAVLGRHDALGYRA